MTTPALTSLQLLQWGIEGAGTHGTAVAATSKIACQGITFTPIDTIARPQIAKGYLVANPGNEMAVMRGTTFSVAESPVVFDQHQHWLAMSVRGAVAAAGGPAYTWTYERTITADPALDTRTIERRLSDGASYIDNEWAYAMLSKIRWLYEPDQPLRFSADGFARRIQSSTLTAGIALPTVTYAPALGTLHLDSSWANIGVTPISGQVLRAEVIFTTGMKPKMTLDGRTDLDFTVPVLDPSEVKLELNVTMWVKTNSGQFATEKAAAEAATLRAFYIPLNSGATHLDLMGLVKHEPGSLQTIGSQDGQEIVEMKFVGATDGTNLFKAVLYNTVNTVT